MNEIIQILDAHLSAHPAAKSADIYKLLYQNEFGGGHLITDLDACRGRLLRELSETCEDQRSPVCTDIGNGRVRLELKNPAVRVLGAEVLCRMFSESAKRTGNEKEFKRTLETVANHLDSHYPLLCGDFREYAEARKAEGYPAVSHSTEYRDSYSPAYRVVNAKYVRLINLLIRINSILSEKKRAVIALEGRSASGKTTAATLISTLYETNIIHMDDFFLPPELRTAERYGEAGGNVHYERFREEVVSGLERQSGFSYRVFDCSRMDYIDTVKIEPKPLTIVEGAYSAHPRVSFKYDLICFFEITSGEQKRRITERNGEQMYERFREIWIPLENKYFDAFSVKKKSELIIE
ncbi:MAG: hypothetical protein GX851_01535 [Clostridiales bacterium]|nr:hypothetical protein [Clostridiales bacterium]